MITYRNAENVTKGLWFYEPTDLPPILQLIGSIMRGDPLPKFLPKGTASAPKSSDANPDQKSNKKIAKSKRSRPPATITTPASTKDPKDANVKASKSVDNSKADSSILQFFPNLKTPESGIVGSAIPPNAQDPIVAENGSTFSPRVLSLERVPNGQTETPSPEKSTGVDSKPKSPSKKAPSIADLVHEESQSPQKPAEKNPEVPGSAEASVPPVDPPEVLLATQEPAPDASVQAPVQIRAQMHAQAQARAQAQVQAQYQAQAQAQAQAQYQAQQVHAHHLRMQAHARAQAQPHQMQPQSQAVPGYGRPTSVGLQVPLQPMRPGIRSAQFSNRQGLPPHQGHGQNHGHPAHVAHMAYLAQQRAMQQQYFAQQGTGYSPPGASGYMGNVPGHGMDMNPAEMNPQSYPEVHFNNMAPVYPSGSVGVVSSGANIMPDAAIAHSMGVHPDHMYMQASQDILDMVNQGGRNNWGARRNPQYSTGAEISGQSLSQSASMIGASMANLSIHGNAGEENLTKNDFRSVIQRMLTDQKLFNMAYDNYTAALVEKKGGEEEKASA